jgi:hypothetical protein
MMEKESVRSRKMETKETVSFRLPKGMRKRIEQAAAKRQPKLNLSEYIEHAVEAQLVNDEIPAQVDFRSRFAHPPKGPHVGDQFVEMLLAEREES